MSREWEHRLLDVSMPLVRRHLLRKLALVLAGFYLALFLWYKITDNKEETGDSLPVELNENPHTTGFLSSQLWETEDASQPERDSVPSTATEPRVQTEVRVRPQTFARMEANWDVERLRQWVADQNGAQVVLNVAQFGPVDGVEIVLLVQVHRRLNDFSVFLKALKDVRGIEKTLLIISMDYVFPELEDLVRGVDFCKVCADYAVYVVVLILVSKVTLQ